jgi:hypothetical protein
MSDPEDFKTHLSGVFSRASSSYDHTGPGFSHILGRSWSNSPESRLAHVSLILPAAEEQSLFLLQQPFPQLAKSLGLTSLRGWSSKLETKYACKG